MNIVFPLTTQMTFLSSRFINLNGFSEVTPGHRAITRAGRFLAPNKPFHISQCAPVDLAQRYLVRARAVVRVALRGALIRRVSAAGCIRHGGFADADAVILRVR